MVCGMKACARTATPSRTPIIVFWASQARERGAACRMEFTGLPICAPCAENMKPDDLLSDEGKAQIEGALKNMGRRPPDWSTAELEWAPIPS